MITAFTGNEFGDLTESLTRSAMKEIEQLSEARALEMNIEQMTQSFHDRYALKVIRIDFENVYREETEKDISLSLHPDAFVRARAFDSNHETVRKTCIEVHFPYEGDSKLFRYKTHISLGLRTDIEYDQRDVWFERICWYDNEDPQELNKSLHGTINRFKAEYEYELSEWNKFNSSLRERIAQALNERKQKAERTGKLRSALTIPLKKRNDIPRTFAVAPITPRQKLIVVQVPRKTSTAPEPSLSEGIYNEILNTIHDVGLGFERLPSIYSNKGEEDVRDMLMLFLEMRFELPIVGEAFNRHGKTDILVKYESHNVFVAECKVWGGEKRLRETDIPQLLRYLTWRDTKTAMIVFVREAGFSEIIKKADAAVKSHPNFLREVDRPSESWINYRLHLDQDKDKEVSMALILFHLPKADTMKS
ncbi:MAG: hypothetical protein JSS75_06000 [Bacteroidetes bacterium]|nr:hypothetical protein [Bacteroidota bacterium]